MQYNRRIFYSHNRALALLAASVAVALLMSVGRAQDLDQDPGHKEYLSVSGIRFSSPDGFDTKRRKATERLVYVPHEEYDLGLFVAVPEAVSPEHLRELSTLMVSYLFPEEKTNYSWKRLDEYKSVSKFEVSGGMMQGFNGKQRVFLQYRQIKVNGVDVLTGYTFGLGRGSEARRLFEQNLGGNSMPGWFAQAHIIASLTGEPYKELNPGTYIISAPPFRRP